MRSYSLDQWLAMPSLSRPFFYKLKASGRGTSHIQRWALYAHH
jgi:hypothetical protein